MEDNQNTGVETPDTESTATTQQAEDPIKNLKAEMNRKLENTNAQLQALLAAINKPATASVAEPAKKVSVFEDEDAYAARIAAETEARIEAKLAKQQAQQQKQAQTINQLVSDFPELTDQSHALTKRAVEIYNSLPDDEKNSPIAYKAAVKEAALELDFKPKSKRGQQQKENDSFALGGGSKGPRPAASSEMDKARESLAAAFGLDVSKADVKERLKQHAKRDFKKFS